MARLLGRDKQAVDDFREGLANRFEHSVGRRVFLYAPLWLAEWIAQRGSPEPTTAPDTPTARDRKEFAQAEKAEIELRRLRGELVSVREIHEDIALVARKIREGIEIVGQFDKEAQRIMIDKLHEAESEFDRHYGIGDDNQ